MRTPTQSAKQRSKLTHTRTYIQMYIYLATATTTVSTITATATHNRMRHLQQYVRKTTTNAPTSGRDDASELHHIFANTARRVLVSNSICLHNTQLQQISHINVCMCVRMYVVSQVCTHLACRDFVAYF